MRAATTVAIVSLSLAGWSSGAFAQQSSTNGGPGALEAAKNTLQRSAVQQQKDALSSTVRGLQASPQALKSARSGEKDSLRKGGQDSDAGQWRDTLRIEQSDKKLSGMAANASVAHLQTDRKARNDNRSSLSRSLKSNLSSAAAKDSVSPEKDSLKKSR
jgi:hypothetical protein